MRVDRICLLTAGLQFFGDDDLLAIPDYMIRKELDIQIFNG